ncbi:DNA-binding protein [Thioclava nitratireducens]|uniref:DNA-binding protein n=1 Tax=Thioclava nitratireducens TaxID=1915078 RepID=A0ABN4XC69_9RHOB|nr:helix-turn-helix domain-containing protein [Thioclava nitratireducens]AQS48750.1 DNA-binding protein [Thioclava nitratireducens]
MRDIHDERLDTAQAANYLGYSKSTLEWWRMVGRGPRYYKIGGGRIRYKQSDLDAYLEAGVVEPREA